MDKKILKLTKPITVSDHDSTKEISEIEYDFENMTARDKITAGKQFKADANVVSAEELDPDYHLYLFAAAACKANADLTIPDVLNMSARDSQKASELARDFFYLSSEN